MGNQFTNIVGLDETKAGFSVHTEEEALLRIKSIPLNLIKFLEKFQEVQPSKATYVYIKKRILYAEYCGCFNWPLRSAQYTVEISGDQHYVFYTEEYPI